MKRILRLAMLMAGLLWLAPAVRALPLVSDETLSDDAEFFALPEDGDAPVAAPDPAAAPASMPAALSHAAKPLPPGRGIPPLLYVGLLGLLILGTDYRVLTGTARTRRGPGRTPQPRGEGPGRDAITG